MSLRPMYDNILVTPVKVEEKTSGGIYLSTSHNSRSYNEGVVIAVGEGYKVANGDIAPLKVKEGDTVIYRKGVEISLDDDNGDEVILFSEANVLAIK